MRHFSILDLAPVAEGATMAEALERSVTLAHRAEALGFYRFWLAEHHNMPGIASAATAVLIGHIAAATNKIRVGAGGIMLPNHSLLMVAEAFGTLATLYPGRIDLGLGRAPGADMATARALRRHLDAEVDSFPDDVVELLTYFTDQPDGTRVRAFPGNGTNVPVWILGSSLYGAQLAAMIGLPYAFASHFAPDLLEQALKLYRENFRPSPWLQRPHAMVAVGVCAAETDAEAKFLHSSQMRAFARLRSGRGGTLPPPVGQDVLDQEIPPALRAQVEHTLAFAAVGSPSTVAARLAAIRDAYQPDEIIIAGSIHDPAASLRSVEIAAEALRAL